MQTGELPPTQLASAGVPTSEMSNGAEVFLIERVTNALVKNVALKSRRIYLSDAKHFVTWLDIQHFTFQTVNFETMSEYRAYLVDHFKKATAARMLVVAKRLLDITVILKLRQDNPANQVKSISSRANNIDGTVGIGGNETPYTALASEQAWQLLIAIDRATLVGKRDYAIISLLLRTGIRRSECAALTLADLRQEQGFYVVFIQHGKGDKRRLVKLPFDVWEALEDYLKATGTWGLVELYPTTPLFCHFKKGSRLNIADSTTPISDKLIERVVKARAKQAGLESLHITPHSLRASFVTLALEGGAKLYQVQYAVGHSDPRTTEHYQRRKLNLQDNAVDYVQIRPQVDEATGA
jgi:integrase/recombinase XerD